MNINLDSIINEKSINKIPIWQVITTLVLIIGYIGFYSYASLNRITFISPAIQVVIGIGIFNLIIVLLMIWALLNVKGTIDDKALRVTIIAILLTYNPGVIGANIILAIMVISTSYWELNFRRNKKKDSQLIKDKVDLTDESIRKASGVFPQLVVLTIGLLFNAPFMYKFYLIYYLMYDLFRIYTRRTIGLKDLLVFCVMLPMAVSFTFLNDTTYSLVGISKVNVEIATVKEPEEFRRFTLVYEHNNKYYLSDSTNLHKTTVMAESDVYRMRILKPEILHIKKGLIKSLRNSFSRNTESTDGVRKEVLPDSTISNLPLDTIR